jgi:hypothetical protein
MPYDIDLETVTVSGSNQVVALVLLEVLVHLM